MAESSSNTPRTKQTIDSLWRLEKIILDTLDFTTVVQKIVDSILTELGYLQLGYRIVVLALIDENTKELKRISISQTAEAQQALAVTPVPFYEISIPLDHLNNLCIKAIQDNLPYVTHNWKDILIPSYTEAEAQRVQEIIGIQTSMVYPVTYRGIVRGVMIFSMVKSEDQVSEDERDLIRGLTEIVGIAVQNAKLYSDLEKTTKRLDEVNKQLESLDKLKDEFVSITSHELRTPMTAIKSYTWMVLNNKAGAITIKTQEYLDRVYQSTERLIHLVNEMLDVSRIEGGRVQLKLEPLDLYKLSTDVQLEFQARATESQLSVEIISSDNLPQVTADREKIHQVLENLIGNSFKFTPSGGKITVSFKVSENKVETSVTDNGKGISSEDMPKLFKKFGRLENSLIAPTSGSTGLGLFICKQYIEMHGGTIDAISEFGKGTTFTFSLPIANQPTPQLNS